MANLLSWNNGIQIKKKEERENTPLVTSLRTMNPVPTTNKSTIQSASGVQNTLNQARQLNEQIRQRAAQRQQEEQKKQQEQTQMQARLNESETNRLTRNYERQINQNTNLLKQLRSGEASMNAGSTNFLGQQAFRQNDFEQAKTPFTLKNNLAERVVENQIKNDKNILERVKNGSRPITLGQGLSLIGNNISQAAGNAILGEQTEDESFGKQLLRGALNIPGSIIGEPMRLPGLLQDAGNPNSTKNVLEKNSDGAAVVSTKENGVLNRLGSAVDAATIPWSMAGGGITPVIAKTAAKGLAKTTLKNAAKQIVKTGAEEASQEAVQNLAQELSENGQWDEGTLGRTAQAAALGGILGGAVSGVTSAAGNLSQIRTTQDGSAVKTNPDGIITRLSNAEMASVIDQNAEQSILSGGETQGNAQQSVANTPSRLNPFQNDAVNLRYGSDDINTLATRAAQGDTYAQQRLAELTGQNQDGVTDWRGKSVDEVINPEKQIGGVENNIREDGNFAVTDGLRTLNTINGQVDTYQGDGEWNGAKIFLTDGEGIPVGYRLMADENAAPSNEYVAIINDAGEKALIKLPHASEFDYERVGLATGRTREGLEADGLIEGTNDYSTQILRGDIVQTPRNVNQNTSSFAENISENGNFSDEVRQALRNNPLTYTPVTNAERLVRANEMLSTKSMDEIDIYLRDNFFNAKNRDRNSGDVVLAGEFAKQLDAKGQYDRSTEIINKMSEIATKQGQDIQALSVVMNRSPEGIANMAQTAIKKSGGEMTGKLRGEIVEKTQEIGKIRSERAGLEQENAELTEKIMNGEGDLPALRKRQAVIAQRFRQTLDAESRYFSQLADTVNKNSPDRRSVFGSVWRAGLLSGPRTHTGNIVSNLFQNALNAGSDRLASGLDWARAKVTGTEREVVASDKGLRARGKGLKRGLKAAGEALKTGDNLWEGMSNVADQTNAWGQGGELEFKNKIANTMVAKPTNFVFRAMSAGDLPFRYAAFENAIRTEARRRGVNQGLKGQALQDYINGRVAAPDPELRAYGMRKGNESVYDIDTKLSDVMNRIDKFIEGQDNKAVRASLRATKTLIAPFVKVPSKVLSTAIDYSPLGTVKAIVNKVGSEKYTVAQFETDLARSSLGTAGLVGLGYALSAAGMLTGGYPDSQDERNRWKAEGIEPNSIKIGDTYLSLNYLGPASMLLSMGSGVQQRQAKGEDPLTVAQGTLFDTLHTFLDQSYVQGLNSALQAVTDSSRYGESYANSLARGMVPNLLRQTATATDPMQRQVNNVGEAITSGIPGLSQTLDAKVDTYGQEIKNKQTLPLGQMWDALKLGNSRDTNAVIDEVSRLHAVDPNNKDLQVTPTAEKNSLSVDGENVRITDKQKSQLQKDTGTAALKAMRAAMQSNEYAGLSDTEKASALDKARSEAQKQARKQFIEANNITFSNNPGAAKSGGAVTGDYTSKAISSAISSGSSSGKNSVEVNNSLSSQYKDVLNKYNSMSSEDWEKYVNGSSAESAAAEYRLAQAKYENDIANGKLTDIQRIKREKELTKLAASQQWEKKYRDAYGLAGVKVDMQAYLNTLDGETRAQTVAVLNGLNNAMHEAGIIQASTYRTRYNAINNTTSRSSGSGSKKTTGISSAEASALSSLAKTMSSTGTNTKVNTPSTPTTKRKMSKTKSGGNKATLNTYTPSSRRITVAKGAKRSIA